MHCPYCRHTDSKVLDSRVAEDGASIRRRRQCPACERRFTTLEQMQLSVVKRSGVVEPFNRDKVVSGVRKACKGRPVNEDQLAKLGQQVEDALRASGQPDVPADEVGVAILGPLRELDQVAYLRFASVYRQYASVDDFEAEIALLRIESEPLGIEPLIPDLDVPFGRGRPARSGSRAERARGRPPRPTPELRGGFAQQGKAVRARPGPKPHPSRPPQPPEDPADPDPENRTPARKTRTA